MADGEDKNVKSEQQGEKKDGAAVDGEKKEENGENNNNEGTQGTQATTKGATGAATEETQNPTEGEGKKKKKKKKKVKKRKTAHFKKRGPPIYKTLFVVTGFLAVALLTGTLVFSILGIVDPKKEKTNK